MSEDQNSTAEPKKSGSKIWLILLIVLGLPTILCGGCCVCTIGLSYLGVSAAKNSEPYQDALQRVVSDPQVVDRLGEPIEVGLHSLTQYKGNDDTGEALFIYGISGPNGTATVNTESEKVGGTWQMTKLTVTFSDDGSTVNLLPGGLDDGLEIDLNLEGDNEGAGDKDAAKAPSDDEATEAEKKN